ncbi:GntR family transcriptional regulator [Parapedobacter pyrenivorans]|uniref:GntR family transcriptional regulator n=1 Tax=Parapedobacter pyrenivorans TaxID=1305674 RepID=UPI003340E9C1
MRVNESKYKKVVNHVVDGIKNGTYKKGDWVPSINEFIKTYGLSRDTVFAGIRELKTRGIISSTPGVGYFIASTRIPSKKNIFLLFNEFNEFKEDLYNSFVNAVEKTDTVDLYFHNYNRKVFETLVQDASGKYTTYVIMPGKFQGLAPLLESLRGNVFLLDHYHPELKGKFASVAQNFEKDTYEALNHGLAHITKYKRILMVQSQEKEPVERYDGLQRFCKEHGFEHEYLNSVEDGTIKLGDLFILVNDRDLVSLLRMAEKQNFVPGQHIGIISYNDTPLKEILAGGITTLSTDFKIMGETMAALVNKNSLETIENPCHLTLRKSL